MSNGIQFNPIHTDAINITQEQSKQTLATTNLNEKLPLSKTLNELAINSNSPKAIEIKNILKQLESEKITKRNISLDTPITDLANILEREVTSLKEDVQKFKKNLYLKPFSRLKLKLDLVHLKRKRHTTQKALDRAERIQNNELGYFEKKIYKIKKIIDWFSGILSFKTIIHPTDKNYAKDLKNIEGTIKGKIEDKKKDLNRLKDINLTTLKKIKKSINSLEEVKKLCDELKQEGSINQNKNIEAKKDDFEVFKAKAISTINLVKIAMDITNNPTDDFTTIRKELAKELQEKEENIPQTKDDLVKFINDILTLRGQDFQKNL